MFIENIKLSLKNFITNKMRTLLSLLGIMIGVSSVILITTLGNSATSNIKNEIASGGMDLIMIYGGWGNARSQKVFHSGLGEELDDMLDTIIASTPNHQVSALAKSRNKTAFFEVNCISPSYAEVFNIEMPAGRFFSDSDSIDKYPGIILGNKTAQTLFPAGGSVGKPLKLIINQCTYQFTVIGVMKKKDANMGLSFNDVILMDLNYYRSRIAKVEVVNSFFLKAADASVAAQANTDVNEYLQTKTSEKDGFWVDSPSSISEMFNKVTKTLNLVLAAIAGISLLVGGIGIMNIMLVSVTERTREIGIRKALGAQASAIRGQFLTESAVLTIIGGILGVILGTVLGKLVTELMKWSFSPVLSAYVLAIGFSAAIGVFFGLYPAVRASRLDPIQALSYE
ncbi:MAG: ABC transporter permease [Spirochaetales bacterium]|nr:ABC transporter permease [Spirochaetales bacterium]